MPANPSNSAFAAGHAAAEPRWRPVERYLAHELPHGSRRWLVDDGSLTARLISLQRGVFSVQRLYQGWQVPLPSERRLLDLDERQIALVREVALRVGDTTMVFARSVFPHSSLTGSLGHLRRLQNRSLGAILFKHPGMHRCPFELARIPGDSPYLPAQFHQRDAAWGRRSRFELERAKLMVSEVFLDAFTPWPSTLPVHRSQRGRVTSLRAGQDRTGAEIAPATR